MSNIMIHRLLDLPLPPGHVIVALESHRGELYAVTNFGLMYQVQGL